MPISGMLSLKFQDDSLARAEPRTESNLQHNLINENTPLAKVLLDSAVGDELKLEIKASLTRFIKVLRIHRQKGTIETHIPPSFYKQLKLTVPFFENKK